MIAIAAVVMVTMRSEKFCMLSGGDGVTPAAPILISNTIIAQRLQPT